MRKQIVKIVKGSRAKAERARTRLAKQTRSYVSIERRDRLGRISKRGLTFYLRVRKKIYNKYLVTATLKSGIKVRTLKFSVGEISPRAAISWILKADTDDSGNDLTWLRSLPFAYKATKLKGDLSKKHLKLLECDGHSFAAQHSHGERV